MKRLSLHCGVNAYDSAPLAGCVADAEAWRGVAVERGYSPTMLLDHRATKAEIVEEIQSALSRLAMGDRFLWTFSGHGSFIADRSGDEVDGRDEVMCAVDFADRGLITDDELYRLVQKRKLGVVVTIISDSCHSGTVSRAVGPLPVEGKSMDFAPRPRFLPPDQFLDGADLRAADRAAHLTGRGWSRPGATLLSACLDHEVAWDAYFDGRPQGAFTRAAIATLPTSRRTREWLHATHRAIDQSQTPQTPQLSAGPWQSLRKPLR